MKARRDASVRSLKLMIAACIVIPLALFCYAAWQNWNSIFSLADERIDQSLDIVAENALKIFQSISVTLTSVDQMTGKSDDRAAEPELHDRFKQMASLLPDIESIWAYDAKGHPLASSAVFPVPSQLDNSDRKYFSSQRSPDAPMFIGEVLQPKISQFPFFPVSKRRTDAHGNFNGIAEVAVLPKAFEDFFAHLANTTSASFALIRDDGVVLARYPLADRPNIQLDASTGFGSLIARSPQGGHYTTTSGVDQIERRFAVKKLEGYPLYVSSSLEISSIRSDWTWLMASHLIFGVPATLLLVVLAVFALSRTKEFYAEAERREAAELSLRQSQKMDAVGQLTGGVSHDFNNLLTIITGNLQLALREVSEGRLQRRLTAALAGADRAAQLTRKLLAFSRNQPLDPRPLDVNQLVTSMSEMLTRTLGENIEIETVGSAGLWQTEVDSSELESAILNLAINARDAIKDSGKLTIETANTFLDENYCRDFDGVKPGQYVLISVSDTGVGMTKEAIDKAFEPFFTTKAPGLGTGLGLSQVYGFVRQSGGHIRIYSELGHGTTVKIYLPRSMTTAPAQPAEEEQAPQGSQELILVVEDDTAVRSYVVEALIDLNYKVVQAENAEKALVILEASKPVQLLLTDVVMPGLNGRALADAAKGLQSDLKVLFMTGYSRNAIVHHGRLDPGVSLIQKPFSRATLGIRIRDILDS